MDLQPAWKCAIVMKGPQNFSVKYDGIFSKDEIYPFTDEARSLLAIWKLVTVWNHQAVIQPHKGTVPDDVTGIENAGCKSICFTQMNIL